jgi:dTDP-4-dehydrorhamnose reductase
MKTGVFITGGSGLFGLNCALILRDKFDVSLAMHKRKIEIQKTKSYFINLNSADEIISFLSKKKYYALIHSAALSSIEECEKNPPLAFFTNVEITRNLALACAATNTRFVYISTDHIFSGTKRYSTEITDVKTLNVYAQTKYLGEREALDALKEAIIVRTNFYGWGPHYRKSFSDFVIKSLRQGQKVSLYSDIYHNPIHISLLVNSIFDLLRIDATGIYNIVSNERLSKLEFGLKLADRFKLNKGLINSINYNAINSIPRPLDMSLDNRKFSSLLSKSLGDINEGLDILESQEKSGFAKEIQNIH